MTQTPMKVYPEYTKEETEKIVKAFAHEILESISGIDQRKNDMSDFIGIEYNDIIDLEVMYPLYRKNQCLFAINKVLTMHMEKDPLSYYNSKRTSPDFRNIQIKRHEDTPLLVLGYYYIKYNDKNIIVKVNFVDDLRSMINIYYDPETYDDVQKLIEAIELFSFTNNFLLGEKLNPDRNGVMNFLEYEKKKWNDLILSDKIKKQINRDLIYPLKNRKEYEKLKMPWKRGILLTGLPGTGKSTLGKVLCNELDCTMIWVTPRDLEEGASTLEYIYDAARDLAPTVVFIEDIDFMGKERILDGGSSLLGELLTQLDGVSGNSGVFTIATTNYPELLDQALSNRPSRFDTKIDFTVPSRDQIKALYSKFLGDNHDLSPDELDSLVGSSRGLTGAYIQEVVIKARQLSIEEGNKGKINTNFVSDALVIVKKEAGDTVQPDQYHG